MRSERKGAPKMARPKKKGRRGNIEKRKDSVKEMVKKRDAQRRDAKRAKKAREQAGCTSQGECDAASHEWKPAADGTMPKLGLVLQQRGDSVEEPCGVRISSVKDTSLQQTLAAKGIVPGGLDFLESIKTQVGDTQVATCSYTEVLNLIKSAGRPLIITFKQDPDDDEFDEDEDDEKQLMISVTGCGNEEVNGTYHVDSIRDGVPSYRKVDGELTIERDAAPGQITQWCFCRDYGFDSLIFVDSEDKYPPEDGWAVSDACKGPPPVISRTLSDTKQHR